MAFSTKAGSFVLNTVTGAQAVTGVGFTPKVVLFFMTIEAADTDDFGASGTMAIGIGVSATARATIARAQGGASATRTSAVNTLVIYSTGGVDIGTADLTSLDADGFTINWSTAPAAAWVVNYIALGGSDLTNVVLKQITAPAATGNQASTGVGFQPDALILISAGLTTASTTSATHAILGLGLAKSSSAQGTTSTVDISRIESTSSALITYSAGSTKTLDAALTSLDSDGFTLNFGTTTSGAVIWVLCLKGGSYAVGAETQKTSTGTKAKTGVGFTPTGILLASVGNTAAAAVDTTTATQLIGAASGATVRGYIWVGDKTAAVDARALNRANLIASYVPSNTSLPATSQADLSSFDSDGFTLNWTTADATAREFIFMAFGNTLATSINPVAMALMGIG